MGSGVRASLLAAREAALFSAEEGDDNNGGDERADGRRGGCGREGREGREGATEGEGRCGTRSLRARVGPTHQHNGSKLRACAVAAAAIASEEDTAVAVARVLDWLRTERGAGQARGWSAWVPLLPRRWRGGSDGSKGSDGSDGSGGGRGGLRALLPPERRDAFEAAIAPCCLFTEALDPRQIVAGLLAHGLVTLGARAQTVAVDHRQCRLFQPPAAPRDGHPRERALALALRKVAIWLTDNPQVPVAYHAFLHELIRFCEFSYSISTTRLCDQLVQDGFLRPEARADGGAEMIHFDQPRLVQFVVAVDDEACSKLLAGLLVWVIVLFVVAWPMWAVFRAFVE